MSTTVKWAAAVTGYYQTAMLRDATKPAPNQRSSCCMWQSAMNVVTTRTPSRREPSIILPRLPSFVGIDVVRKLKVEAVRTRPAFA